MIYLIPNLVFDSNLSHLRSIPTNYVLEFAYNYYPRLQSLMPLTEYSMVYVPAAADIQTHWEKERFEDQGRYYRNTTGNHTINIHG